MRMMARLAASRGVEGALADIGALVGLGLALGALFVLGGPV
jgi:hypothetical protein